MSDTFLATATDTPSYLPFHRLLSAVLGTPPKVYTPPTCSCVLAVDLGLPTKIAFLLLDLLERQGKLLRVDLKPLVRERRDFHRILSDAERSDIENYDGELYAYFAPEDLGDTHELLSPLVIQLALMLRIQHVVLFYDAERLKWGFQVATKALRKYDSAETPNPVAARAPKLGGAGVAWRRAHQSEQEDFEGFEVNTSTQLRILMHLALQVAGGDEDAPRPWSLERLKWTTPTSRSEILQRLGRVLLEGVETPPAYRSGYAARVVGNTALIPDNSKLWSGESAWYQYLAEHRNSLVEALGRWDDDKERWDDHVFRDWFHLSMSKMTRRREQLLPELRDLVSDEDMGKIFRESIWRSLHYAY